MSFLFAQSKYKDKYLDELRRELKISNLQNEKGYSREHAVRFLDYQKELGRHNTGSNNLIIFRIFISCSLWGNWL